jgi:23S rRNA (guanosine2251-2'-O)-methyltransferase
MRRLIGIHAVAAAVRSAQGSGSGLERVIVAQGRRNNRLQAVIDDCRKAGIPVRFEPKASLQRVAGTGAHQNIIAILSAERYQTLEDVLENASDQSTLVVLDSVQDPHNLGAIIRSADGAGATAVVLPERRSASLTEAAAKAASGALESVPVVRVKNLGRALEQLKEADFWTYGFEAESPVDYDAIEYSDRCALVLGGESRGLREKVAERCDFLVRIPLTGAVSSLNVSVAAGIALFEVRRQRRSQSQI